MGFGDPSLSLSENVIIMSQNREVLPVLLAAPGTQGAKKKLTFPTSGPLTFSFKVRGDRKVKVVDYYCHGS